MNITDLPEDRVGAIEEAEGDKEDRSTEASEKVGDRWVGLKGEQQLQIQILVACSGEELASCEIFREAGLWLDNDGAPEAVLGLLQLAALQQKVGAHLQGLRVVSSVHLERALRLTELYRELELTLVQQFGGLSQQLLQAVSLLGNCVLLGKLVSLGALL